MAFASTLLVVSCSAKKKSELTASDTGGTPSLPGTIDAQRKEIAPEMLVLRQVLVEEGGDGDLSIARGLMAKKLASALVASEFLAADEGEVPDRHNARRVEVFLAMSFSWTPAAQPGTGHFVLAAEARIEFIEDRSALAPRAAILMEASVPRSAHLDAAAMGPQETLDDLAAQATAVLAESIVSRERLRRAPHAELLSEIAMGLKDPSMRIWALQLAAERGLRDAVPAAIEALDANDDELRAAAVSVLVELRDARAVSALVKHVDFNSHEDLRVAMEAITAIGGDEAEEFLEFVASGHSDPELAERATESLRRLRSSELRGQLAP